MLICKGVIYGHIMEVWLDVALKKSLDDFEIELRVHKYSSKVGFNHVW